MPVPSRRGGWVPGVGGWLAEHKLFATDVDRENVRIVTAYRPTPDEWDNDGKTRRTP